MMATLAIPRPLAQHRPSSTLGTLTTTIALETLSPKSTQCPIPNKHIPSCPTGPMPSEKQKRRQEEEPSTTGSSSTDEDVVALVEAADKRQQSSLLYPPVSYKRLESGSLSLYLIEPAQVASALDHTSRQPLPDPSRVFPWLHGLHPLNHIQQAFFVARHRSPRRVPRCLRGVAVVKADGDLSYSRLKGAIAPDELLRPSLPPSQPAEFLDVDPTEGFSVRNFQIQAAKSAMTSDIIVYSDGDAQEARRVGWDLAAAQVRWREKLETQGQRVPRYNTFVCSAPFSEFENAHPAVVAVRSDGMHTGNVLDFITQERAEMYMMSRASEICHNVYLGPTPEPGSDEEQHFDVLIECSDLGRLNPEALRAIAENPDDTGQEFIDFPSSGSIEPPTWSHAEADDILATCKWIWHISHGTLPTDSQEPAVEAKPEPAASAPSDRDGDVAMVGSQEAAGGSETAEPATSTAAARSTPHPRPRRVLIHCADGYTESTMLGIAYFAYGHGLAVPDAWLKLHTERLRNFFAYPRDVALLTSLSARILSESPAFPAERKTLLEIARIVRDEPRWLPSLDGSFPSRVLDYMYLGNLGHANNPDLLRALGIGQILSVGETAMWRDGELEEWGADNICLVENVQDNGIDPLMDEIERCLDFIERGRRNGTATLVHCRVGVSRSATICIAEVMRELGLSFPRAYCFVRARRLNVIIQPHLRFSYELLKWEEHLQRQHHMLQQAAAGPGAGAGSGAASTGIRRELEWGEIAREIALMNRPYSSR